MTRVVAEPSVVVSTPPVVKTSEGDETPAVALPTFEFIKNRNTQEPLILKDGRVFVFPRSFFATTDANLAKELTAMGDQHGIIVNNP